MNWINFLSLDIPLTEINICDFCEADKAECGEYPECCYRQFIETKEE